MASDHITFSNMQELYLVVEKIKWGGLKNSQDYSVECHWPDYFDTCYRAVNWAKFPTVSFMWNNKWWYCMGFPSSGRNRFQLGWLLIFICGLWLDYNTTIVFLSVWEFGHETETLSLAIIEICFDGVIYNFFIYSFN